MSLPPKWTLRGAALRAADIIREPGDVVLMLRIGAFLVGAPSRLRRHHVRNFLGELRHARPRVRAHDLDAACRRIERLRQAWLRRRFLRGRDSCYLRSLTLYRFLDPGERPMRLHFGIEDKRDATQRLRAHVWVSIGERTYEGPPVPLEQLREMPIEALP